MALSAIQTNIQSNANLPLSSAFFTPPDNSFLVVEIGRGLDVTVTGFGVTWTLVADAKRTNAQIWVANIGTGSNDRVRVEAVDGDTNNTKVNIWQFFSDSGGDISLGSGGFFEDPSGSTGETFTITLDPLANENSVVFATFSFRISPPTGFVPIIAEGRIGYIENSNNVLEFTRTEGGYQVVTGIVFEIIESVGGGTDTTAPIITVVEGNLTITESDAVPSFTVSADDGSTIVETGNADTNIPAVYPYTFNATDAAGNAATEVTRTITVVAAATDSIINMTLTGIPNGTYLTRVIRVSTSAIVFSGNIDWSSGTASQLITDVVPGIDVEYYVIGTTNGGLDRGTTA
jgi:hypothetical protein